MVPKFFCPRSVPFILKNAIDIKLNRLVDAGILKKVKFSLWATPIVPVPKKDCRLCLWGDYKVTVYQSLEIDQLPLLKPELFATLSEGKLFSKIDMTQALDDESQKLVTRLPFGITAASAIFQRAMDSLLQGIPNVVCYLDDILITGKTTSEHLQNLRVLRRLKLYNLTAKPSKCLFLQKSVNFFWLFC